MQISGIEEEMGLCIHEIWKNSKDKRIFQKGSLEKKRKGMKGKIKKTNNGIKMWEKKKGLKDYRNEI